MPLMRYDDEEAELTWRTVAALAPNVRWMAPNVIALALGAGEDGLGARDCGHVVPEAGSSGLYELVGAMYDAAAATGFEVPWEMRLVERDLKMVIIDNRGALALMSAAHYYWLVDNEIE